MLPVGDVVTPLVPVAPAVVGGVGLAGFGFGSAGVVLAVGFAGFDVVAVAALGAIAPDGACSPPAACSNSFRCLRNSPSFARIAGSIAAAPAAPDVPAVP